MNFILIFSDGWRADFANDSVCTPNLHKFLKENGGHKFVNAYSTTNWTWAALMSMFTGLLPAHHGCDDISFNKHVSLQKVHSDYFKARNCTKEDFLTTKLKSRKYITKTFDNAMGMKYMRGTGQLLFDKEIVQSWHWYPLLDMTKEVVEEPFFYFVRICDAGHAPWGRFPRGSKEEFNKYATSGEFPNEHIARADPAKWTRKKLAKLLREQCIQWDEEQMKPFLQWFVDIGLYETTAIFLVSDHGVSLGEHGPVGHGMGCHEELIRVPLYVYWPKSRSGLEEVCDLVSIVDMMPTILGESFAGDGVSLFEREKDRAVFFETKRQHIEKGVEYEFKELPSYDVFVRGVRWETCKLTYTRELEGTVKIELRDYGKEKNQLKRLEEGFEKLQSMYSDLDV